MNEVAVILPFTSNLEDGLEVPIPTLALLPKITVFESVKATLAPTAVEFWIFEFSKTVWAPKKVLSLLLNSWTPSDRDWETQLF